MTLNLGSHFATLLGLPLTMLIVGGGQLILNLGGHFAGITSDNVDPEGGRIDTATCWDQYSTWEVTLQLCWDYLGVVNQHSTWEVTLTSPGSCQSTLNLGNHYATWLGLPLTMLILGGQGFDQHSTLEVTLQLWWDYF